MKSTACVIEANPDVSGVGIRISIYALCLGGAIVSYLLRVFAPGEDPKEFSRGVSSALGIQGLALLCTAIYQTFKGDLTLFHAICVLHLLALLGTDLVNKGRYAGFGPRRLYFFAALQVLILGAFTAFNIYVWVTAPHFGSRPECNASTVYVVFGVSITAISPVFRYIVLAILAATVAWYALIFTCILPCLCGYHRYKKRKFTSGNTIEGQKQGWMNWFVEVNFPVDQNIMPPPPKKLHGQELRKYTFNRVVYCSFCVYLIVSLEQTIQRNRLNPEEKGWTFGQVIAIFLLLGVANELVNVLLARWDRNKAESSREQALVRFRPSTGNSRRSSSV